MSQTKFTPQLQDPNYIPSVSGGNEAGQEIEKLGRIGGNFLGTSVQIRDNANLDKIKAEAEVIATDLEAQASENFDIPGKAKERLNMLGLAGNHGTISETALTIKANEMAKDLKGKFPGYEDIIDQEIDKRVFSGLRGRTLQRAFDELSAAEKAAKAAQDDRDRFAKEMAKAGALIHANEHSTDVYELGGVLYDYTASENNWVAREAKKANLDLAQAQLTYDSGSFNLSQSQAEAERDRKARNFTAAHVALMMQDQIPQVKNMINLAATNGLSKDDLLKGQAIIEQRKSQALQSYVQDTGKSYAEAASDLAPIYNAWDGVSTLMSDEKINHASVSRILNKMRAEDVFAAASLESPMLLGLRVAGGLGLPEGLTFDLLSPLIADGETGKSFAHAITKATQESIPVSDAINMLGLTPEEKVTKMAASARQAKVILQKGLPTPDSKEYFIKNLSVVAAGKTTLGSDPVQGQKFLNSFYSGPNAKLVIKTLKEFANDPSAQEQLELARHLAEESLNHTMRQIETEVLSDTLLDAKGDLTKVFSYDEKSGTISVEAKRTKPVFVRSAGIVDTIQYDNKVLQDTAKNLQTSINILNELGEAKKVKDFLIGAGLIPDPEEKKETKGSM